MCVSKDRPPWGRERIWIASPYFVPDEGVVHALQLARLRGVDIRVKSRELRRTSTDS
jgi:hypothetical protein